MIGWRENSGSAFSGCSDCCRAGIERRKIFRRLVVDHLRVVEGWHRHDLGLEREEAGQSDQQRERYGVIDDRLEKSGPGKRARHEHIWPERRWSGTQFERRKAARKDEIAQVAEEDTRPGRQLDQKPRNGRG